MTSGGLCVALRSPTTPSLTRLPSLHPPHPQSTALHPPYAGSFRAHQHPQPTALPPPPLCRELSCTPTPSTNCPPSTPPMQGAFVHTNTLNYHAILDTALDVAKAMCHLHAMNVLHSDLKV